MTDEVYLTATNMPSRPSYHASRDCPRLQGAVRPVPRAAVEGYHDACPFCHDGVELGGATTSDVYRALTRAGPDDLPLGGGV